jgi:hypothetical protein
MSSRPEITIVGKAPASHQGLVSLPILIAPG